MQAEIVLWLYETNLLNRTDYLDITRFYTWQSCCNLCCPLYDMSLGWGKDKCSVFSLKEDWRSCALNSSEVPCKWWVMKTATVKLDWNFYDYSNRRIWLLFPQSPVGEITPKWYFECMSVGLQLWKRKETMPSGKETTSEPFRDTLKVWKN